MTSRDSAPGAPDNQGFDWRQVSAWTQGGRRDGQAQGSSAPPGSATDSPGSRTSDKSGDGAPYVQHQGLAAVDFGTSSSTVTLFDRGERIDVALSTEQRRCLGRGLANLMDNGLGGSAAVNREWRQVVANVAEFVLTDQRWQSPGTVTELAPAKRLTDRLRSESATAKSGLTDYVARELEQSVASQSPELRQAANYALAQVIDAAFREPPLSVLRLFRVPLIPGSHDTEIPSIVYDNPADGLITMQEPSEGGDGTGQHFIANRGLKQRLGMPTSPSATGDEVGLGKLIGGALAFLVGKANAYLADERTVRGFTAGHLERIVITYPTMAPPVVRETLHKLVEDLGIDHVVDRYDEAVAASMFLLMRDFGGSFDPAVEAFAARSYPMPRLGESRPRHWRHTMLVVDIGGGTTDIALLRLDLFDDTPDTPGSGSPQRGRFYRVVPRVLGTTGESQRGGEFITLLVFRWIKALIADHLLTTRAAEFDRELSQLREEFRNGSGYRRDSLVSGVLDGDESAMAFALDAVNLVVPTRWAAQGLDEQARQSVRQLFERIWNLADKAKIALSKKPEDHDLVRGDIASIFAQLRRQRRPVAQPSSVLPGESAGPVGQAGVEDWAEGFLAKLAYERFREQIEDVVRDQAELARDLVDRLPGLDHAADGERAAGAPAPVSRLDRVVLTGRGSQLPGVREQLIEALTSQAGAGDTTSGGAPQAPVEWDPGNLFAEDDFAKHATSIGAAWAESINDAVAAVPEEEKLNEGAVFLSFEVDQLLSFMRGTFKVDAAYGGGSVSMEDLFQTGTPFLREGDRLVLRNEKWIPMPPLVTVRRQPRATVKETDKSVAWCGFSLQGYLRNTPGQKYDGDTDALQRRLFFKVEATPELDMRILLSTTRDPDRVRSASFHDVGDHVRDWFVPDVQTDGDKAPDAADADAEIVVNPGIPGSMMSAGGEAVFSRSAIRRGERVMEFAIPADGERHAAWQRCRGVVSRKLPPPRRDGWSFHLRNPADPEQPKPLIAHVPLTDVGASYREHRRAERAGTPPLYTAVLDDTGHLTVYAGEPPFLPAGSLTELDEVPGSMLTAVMASTQADYHSPDDPFSGTH